ncbi:hypothetical protein [Dactylosporangium matsuzakiense]|uniref:hypothetical protein n=1 Tax=Dactylosporangium matsuzakiense TaxID=53360 RepID=UPI0021C450B8|nr:hypothetical protein [Dactylosporangium matsuzakiense]UWZ47790.1 hypothetical protein Dmats_16135 [Dactylosporangium matsuzakiense]
MGDSNAMRLAHRMSVTAIVLTAVPAATGALLRRPSAIAVQPGTGARRWASR